MKRVLTAFLAALAAPGAAGAADATLVTRDLAVGGGRAVAAAASARFDLVGVHWQGRGSVSFRTRGVSGRWSGWRVAAPEAEDQPNRTSREAARSRGWRVDDEIGGSA